MKIASIIAALFFMIFAAVMFHFSLAMSPGISGDVGAGFFPRVVSLLAIVCGLFIIFGELRKSNLQFAFGHPFRKALFMGLITALYVYLMPILGFVIVTPFFIAGFLLLLKERRPFVVILFSIVITTLIYLVFRMGLNVRLATSFFGF